MFSSTDPRSGVHAKPSQLPPPADKFLKHRRKAETLRLVANGNEDHIGKFFNSAPNLKEGTLSCSLFNPILSWDSFFELSRRRRQRQPSNYPARIE
jgi:hypothetical protein